MSQNRVVLVICDGLRDDTARDHMGYMELLVESGMAGRFTSRSMLPTASRPNYETLHTGVTPAVHGIASNLQNRMSRMANTFSLATEKGLTTAASAYHWVSELYHASPFEQFVHADFDNSTSHVHHGRFYRSHGYPDSETFSRAMLLTKRHSPHYLLVHPMGVDHAGHAHGSDSPEYRTAANLQDQMLGMTVPKWLELGYTIVVTSDHGANTDRTHGGTTDDVRLVPLYIVTPEPGRGDTGELVDHTQVAPTVWRRLGIPAPEAVADPIDL